MAAELGKRNEGNSSSVFKYWVVMLVRARASVGSTNDAQTILRQSFQLYPIIICVVSVLRVRIKYIINVVTQDLLKGDLSPLIWY